MQQHPPTPRTRHLPATLFSVAVFGLALAATGSASADAFTAALTGGKPKLDIRVRYENVDQDNALKEADSLTVRSRLGYETGDFYGFRVYGEFEDITALVDDYAPERAGFSTVADPEATEVNQIYLGYKGLPGTDIVFGRQRIIYDNARFIGNVGFRQNEQTYDAFRVSNKSLPGTTLNYAHLWNVNTILATDTDIKAHLANVAYAGLPIGTLTGYAYLLEFPNAPTTSTKTLGLSLRGKHTLSGIALGYLVEYAKQTDYKSGDNRIDADYTALELAATLSGVTATLGYEQLGADSFSGFETPLATLHAFNGWADQFLIGPTLTPTDGLDDVYFSVGGSVMGVGLLAVYHDYSADSGSADYGSEWNVQAIKKFAKHYEVGVKYASYDADTFRVDTDKFWVWAGFSF